MKFSIIVPAYKDQFLKKCIDSILAQTYKDLELIIVNDCSPYDVDVIVKQYHDERIRYYVNDHNYGAYHLVENWNHCLEYAKGEYVINMGDDDMLLPNCLQDYVTLIEKHPGLDAYHTRLLYIDEDDNIIQLQEDRPDWESVYSVIWHDWHGRIQMIGDWMYRTSALREKGGYFNLPLAWGADHITSFIMSERAGVANNHQPGLLYRKASSSISNKEGNAYEKVKTRKQVRLWYEHFLEKEPSAYMDKLYRKDLIKKLDEHIDFLKYMEVSSDMLDNFGKLLGYLRHSNDLELSKLKIISKYQQAVSADIKQLLLKL